MPPVDRVKALARAGSIRLSLHAARELAAEGFVLDDLFEAIDTAVLVEDYPLDARGASCLISGVTESKRHMHLVCTTWTPDVLVITVYEPKLPKWVTPAQRVKP